MEPIALSNNEQTAVNPKGYLFSNRDLLRLFLPLTVEQGLEFLVGIISSVMVAFVGEAAVSGVSLVESVMALLISLFAALATGGAVIAGQYLGSKQRREARESAQQMFWFVSIISIVIMIAVYAAKSFILFNLFGQISDEVRRNADTYLVFVSLSIPFLAAYNAGAAIFRTTGNAIISMKIALLMNFINVAGSAMLLYGFHMGTEGVAIATLISRIIAAAIILVVVVNPDYSLHIQRSLKHKFDWRMIKQILSIGIPYGLENSLFFIGRIIVLSLVSTLGTAAITANAIGGSLAVFEVLPGVAINLGFTAIIARCVGAGDYEQAKYYTKKIMAIVYASQLVFISLILALLPLIMKVYGLSEATAELTRQLAWWHGVIAIILWPFAYTLPVTFRAAGDAKYPMAIGIMAMFLCRVVLAYLLGAHFHMGVFGTWIAMFSDWGFRFILFTYRYFNGKWMRYRVI
ncbi:putative MATE family efflux protein [Paenibacillus taihuensis]|uniref:Probable multidrug resistance protein NorM n=1 Tax=Paenibacillus taihuensis TaxID=1156355 RepID=A0A3D9SEP2_9BACL|nr:MATE family efflux transporter [Paenibacillus taihuensis]REE94349.1 putative MATE family efflux protein [Paenibacillus taihuensis]